MYVEIAGVSVLLALMIFYTLVERLSEEGWQDEKGYHKGKQPTKK